MVGGILLGEEEVIDEFNSSSKGGDSQTLELAVDVSSTSFSSTNVLIPWRPRKLAFCPYSPSVNTDSKPQLLRVVVRRPVSDLFLFCILKLLKIVFN